MSISAQLSSYIQKDAKSKGALMAGFTKIRLTEPLIVFAFPFTEKWFFSHPLTATKLLGQANSLSRRVMDSTTKILTAAGYTARQKTIWSLYGDFRPLAVAAGLGNWGRNGIIVNKEHGAGLLFTAIFTNAPLELSAKPQENHCQNCGSCIRDCPAQAFGPQGFLPHKCLPYCLKGCARCLQACTRTLPC